MHDQRCWACKAFLSFTAAVSYAMLLDLLELYIPGHLASTERHDLDSRVGTAQDILHGLRALLQDDLLLAGVLNLVK